MTDKPVITHRHARALLEAIHSSARRTRAGAVSVGGATKLEALRQAKRQAAASSAELIE